MALRLLPGSDPGEQCGRHPPTFDQARADFEVAWGVFLSRRTSDFQAWRVSARLHRAEVRHVGNAASGCASRLASR